MLTATKMTATDYAITLTVFSVCYAVFEVPSNWIMKHYVRPSLWLAFLLAARGFVTIGFAGVQNYATVLSLRLLIGIVSYRYFCDHIWTNTFSLKLDSSPELSTSLQSSTATMREPFELLWLSHFAISPELLVVPLLTELVMQMVHQVLKDSDGYSSSKVSSPSLVLFRSFFFFQTIQHERNG